MFRPLWSLAYGALIRGVAAYLLQGTSSTAYIKGGFVTGPVYGISDVDLVIIGQPQVAASRWKRLCGALPFLADVFDFSVGTESELRQAESSDCMTYGLHRRNRRERVPPSWWVGAGHLASLTRPGLYGLGRDWRRIAGPECRTFPQQGDDQRSIAAWLELQFWCRHAFAALARPSRWHAYLCFKLVAEPARVWLWFTRGERVDDRTAAIKRAMTLLPDETDAFRLALRLRANLRKAPAPPFRDALGCLLRITSRIAATMEESRSHAGDTPVRLLWGGATELVMSVDAGAPPSARLLPLVDWRARVLPGMLDELFFLAEDDREITGFRAVATSDVGDAYPAVQYDRLLLFPTAKKWTRAALRSVQCAVTDPVSFAVIEGDEYAAFPNLAGWSAQDGALRAVAEHRAWLGLAVGEHAPDTPFGPQPDGGAAAAASLSLLFSAARAGLFCESVIAGRPELPLTLAAVERLLNSDIAHAAATAYRRARVDDCAPSATVVADFRKSVLSLPPYEQ